MTQRFNEYLDINYNEKLDDLTKLLIHDAYEAGAESRQDEVSKLQSEIDELKSVITKQQIQMLQIQQSCSGCDSRDLLIGELQKRIDIALEKCYTGIRKQGGDYYLELVEDILKGEETK